MRKVFTKQEQIVLLMVACVLFVGALVHFGQARFSKIHDFINGTEQRFYSKININNATEKDLEAIPFIGAYTARNIVLYREEIQLFEKIEDIKKVKGIKDQNYEKFKNYITIQ